MENLTPSQKSILALLAYECLNFHTCTLSFDKAKYSNRIDTAAHACALLNIPTEIIYNVRTGKITGVQNLNRFSGVVLFEHDYNFNVYCKY